MYLHCLYKQNHNQTRMLPFLFVFAQRLVKEFFKKIALFILDNYTIVVLQDYPIDYLFGIKLYLIASVFFNAIFLSLDELEELMSVGRIGHTFHKHEIPKIASIRPMAPKIV